ncbi:hypothetical protein AMR41_26940 [Hapalosiphon sp. MRB220]|nr:hypothetical protein AMR41_26940 [Hapalosiphon sp. MRB220]
MSNEELLQKLHQTWAKALIHDSWNEYAAIIVDAELSFKWDWDNNVGDYVDGLLVYLPFNVYSILSKNDEMQDVLKHYFLTIAKGHIPNWYNSDNFIERFPIEFRVKLLDIEEDWQKIIKFLITKSKDLNQGRVSEIVFTRKGKEMLIYNEMKFASQSEIRIAQELERRGILFFPLPLAVRCESGEFYKDHREVDFLICLDGTFGILEVSYHEGRYEKDKEKDAWFKKSGILCVESYLSEQCYNQPTVVVNEFLSILAKHKR